VAVFCRRPRLRDVSIGVDMREDRPPTAVISTAVEKSLSYQPGPRPEPKSKRGRPRKTRDQRLSEARTRIRWIAPNVLPARALKRIQDRVLKLHEDMHRLENRVRGFEGSRVPVKDGGPAGLGVCRNTPFATFSLRPIDVRPRPNHNPW
jgi:hypothetical protein